MSWWYPYKIVPQCAISCGSFGKTEKQALVGNHGTDDERFFQFFSMQG